MSSWIVCRCGQRIHTNLFSGGDHQILVSEQFLDQDFGEKSAEDLTSGIILNGEVAVTCAGCHRLHLLNQRTNTIRTFISEPDTGDVK